MLFAQFWRKERFRSVAIKLSYKTCNGIAELFKLVLVEARIYTFFFLTCCNRQRVCNSVPL
jgi:hypothetical protein